MTEPAMKSYRVLRQRELNGAICARAGEIVYQLRGYDYGCAGDDTRMLGVHHVSVTHQKDGDYPFFTIPAGDLEQVSP